jgi:hypothetical protein
MKTDEYAIIVAVIFMEITSGGFETASATAAATIPQFATGPQK